MSGLNHRILIRNLILGFCILSFLIAPIVPTSAELVITPKNTLQEKSLFYKVSPREVLESAIDIKNTDQIPVSSSLQVNDIKVTTDGSITLLQNSEANNQLASWIGILKGVVQVQPNDTVSIPFKITIPQDSKSGEFAAGISITSQKTNETKASLLNTVKKGLKVYVYVQDGLPPTLSTDVNSLQILNIDGSNSEELQKKLSYWDKNNLVFSFNAQDTGNIFSVLKGNYTLTYADGKEETGFFSKNLAPNTDQKEYFISTNLPYKVGQTRLKLEYATEALNASQYSDVKNEQISGVLSANSDTNTETLKKFRGIEKVIYENANLDQKARTVKNLLVILGALVGFLGLKFVIERDKSKNKQTK
jgi:hypothetical protein